MVDIIDVMLAKKMSTQGQVETLAAQARTAVKNAENAIEQVNSINEQAQANNEYTETLATKVDQISDRTDSILADVEDALVRIDETALGSIDDELDKFILTLDVVSTNNVIAHNLIAAYPSEKIVNIENIIKMYKSNGQNEDGTMTQKAITDYVDSKIGSGGSSQGGGGGAATNFGYENNGKMLKVGENGYAKVSNIKEEELVEALIKLGSYAAINAVGVENDYESRTSTRIQEAKYYTQPSNYDTYSMYGGRMRCNVDDTGVITAFYGDSNYREDGSNGQVMIYQPKFYYQRLPSKLVDKKVGRTIRKETIIVSDTEQTGFKLHPLFKTPDGEVLDYVLISAYEGGLFDTSENVYVKIPSQADYDYDKLSSIAGVKPISGVVDDFTLQNAERLARNRGEGWHITNMAVESVNQMLGMIEYNTLNAQAVLGNGVSSIGTSGAGNCSSYTGSTSSLGNASGSAARTTNEISGVETVYSENGYKAISYRGMENVYGNNWRFVGDTLLFGDGTKEGGEPYICNSYNYSSAINSNYSPIGFTIPSIYGWISGFGYGNEEYDWVFMPAECSDLANSAAPIGDNLWSIADLNNTNAVLAGGNWAFGLSNGPFYYACDRTPNEPTRSYCARLMFIPTKNYVYHSNILKWNQKMGG